ncbi:uncharacterized protein LOC115222773 [Octopus sinensis]|uniref:Uncharacterized protein LOC115222773 n=1 Tax=Octopus sinensis TaxID=2607531 RepID=A0A6P7TCV3_9MOLL|nr:uncharacterized protein LOC115222773 [Octopus sinensis]
MLNHLPETVKEGTLLVSFDVVNLYTNIPHDYGIEAITFRLEKYPEAIPGRINHSFIIEALKFILLNNFFMFDTTYYRQKCGIAMGTRAAPLIANLVMSYLELKLYQSSLEKYGASFNFYLKENWKRYLDDCFIL